MSVSVSALVLCVNDVYVRVGMVLVVCNTCISDGDAGSDMRKNLSNYLLLRQSTLRAH